MTKERWQDIVEKIKDNFSIEEHSQKHLDEAGGLDIDYIIFKGPLGKMKLEFISKPVILDKKTKYSNRIGAQIEIEYVYSQTEKSFKLKVFKWDEAIGDWQEIEARGFNF
ncbi:MAG: hypothetical protein ABH818_00860 [Patescibacteria group bacterium]|nr:hypothetical protein [Patescibacteria group bacterium]MBU1870665.1 hypothetical protein [Patescibacteria group bacterium]